MIGKDVEPIEIASGIIDDGERIRVVDGAESPVTV